jgi:hypothetical protein
MSAIPNAKITRSGDANPRPFALLKDSGADWFGEHDVPFMMQVFQICAEKWALIPPVSLYHHLISAFPRLSGAHGSQRSFNENESVVSQPKELIRDGVSPVHQRSILIRRRQKRVR